MSQWLASPDGPTASLRSHDRAALPAGAVALALSLGLLLGQARFRVGEAWITAWFLRLFRLHSASALGPNVVFPLHGRWVGFELTVACTAALLLVPFFATAGLLLVVGRVDRGRAAFALLVATAVIFAVNQVRLLVIAGSMLAWGFQTGYERSHVFLGTVLSTVGVIAGVIVFIWMLTGGSGRRHNGSFQ